MNRTNEDTGTVMIGGGELGRCPTRIHHDRYNTAERTTDPVVEHRIAEGRRWEDAVVSAMLEGMQPTVAVEPRPMNSIAPTSIRPPNTREKGSPRWS